MALASPSSAETLHLKLEKSDAEIPPTTSITPPSLLTPSADSSSVSAHPATPALLENPNPNPNPPDPSPALYSNPSTGLTPPAAPSFTPSFRPLGPPSIPQFTTVPNSSIQPPGVAAPLVSVNPMMPGPIYHAPPGLPLASAPLPYGPNGYLSVPASAPHAIPPPAPSYGFCRERLACPYKGYLRDYFGSPIFCGSCLACKGSMQ